MKYYTADSYSNYTIEKEFEENRKMYAIASCKCSRCGGTGYFAIGVHNNVSVLSPHDGGMCWNCNGSKIERKKIRLYTEEEKEKLDRAKENRKNKELAEKRDAAAEKIMKWKRNECFSVDNKTYVPIGNTYLIKDELKVKGAKYNNVLGWHLNKKLEEYETVEISFEECAEIIDDFGTIKYKTDFNIEDYLPEEEIEEGEYLEAKEKDRLYNLNAKYIDSIAFDGKFGPSYMHKFKVDNKVVMWSTTSTFDLNPGDICLLTGTVKKFQEYKGVKQTWLTRCVIK